jgi:chromosome segregation protein
VRLRHLELQGYKTFAFRTEFAFDGGITAIVGPNGSGKSNIADAIRWVLGEQSYRALRGKRTEDMIFSGSALRSRLGMASASLILDNADGWLPVDFAEVTVTRRAYRSGENEYLLNGSRVRLRDINELLAASGLGRRGYTVIGQGLVDAVLSLRAEDRRALFEEAAGISLYQSKRADALARLEETRSNLVRVNDIINEIAPRLRRLERESERAEHYAMLSQQLEGVLRIWYGFRWRQGQLDLQRARDALNRRAAVLNHRRELLDELDDRVAALRGRQAQLREQMGAWHRESSSLHGQMEEVQRDLAVWHERARLLAHRRDELDAEMLELEVQKQAFAEQIAAAERDLALSQADLDGQKTLVSQAQAALDAHEEQHAVLSRQIADAQATSIDLVTRSADRRNRLVQLDERRTALGQERAAHQAAVAADEAAAADLEVQIQSVKEEQQRLQAEEETLAAEWTRLDAEVSDSQAEQVDFRTALTEAHAAADRLCDRYELLTRLRAEGEGLHAGVRAVLLATRTSKSPSGSSGVPRLSGVLGTVAQLIRVPEKYETAIEVALGGRLQNMIVESWSDAERAIAYLKSGNRGRVTFLPLDTIRPARRLELPGQSGVEGLAADLVEARASLAPVVDLLLGRTIVALDLEAARRTFDLLQGGFQIVTLGGDVLRSSGSVTGGQGEGQVQGQMLAREREWRQLPALCEAARARCPEIESALDEARADEERLREQLDALVSQQEAVAQSSAELDALRRDLERQAAQLSQQVAWRQHLVAQLDEEDGGLDTTQAALQAELQELLAQRGSLESRMVALQAELGQLQGEALYQRLSEARTAEAVARGTRDHRGTALNGLRERSMGLDAQIEEKRQRVASLAQERAALEGQIADQASRETVIQGWLAALARKIDPAEAEVAQLEAERERLEEEENAYRVQLREAESSHAQALLTSSRHEDRLHRLREQIMDDFGLVDLEMTDGLPEQPPLPMGEMVSALPVVEALPAGLEREMHELKAQLRRMGSVNPDAPAEYGEVLDRHTFLTTQAADLEEAAQGLREVISELDEVMSRELQSTFKLVSAHFRENFTQLFGGGSARLILTDPDDISQAGIEVVAQPPGRRQQTLALLSGGERSLTAVALIFALLEVSAPPFCVLDEVDAMLDEVNVRRFRQALEKLAERTQFIVITHNRRTIEAADTIYGISMGDDSVSQVVSLRLEGDRIATAGGTAVEILKDG